jgi:hypothetical protein
LLAKRLEEEKIRQQKEREKLLEEGKILDEKDFYLYSFLNKNSNIASFDVFADYLSSSSPISNPDSNDKIDGISKELLDKFSFLADDYNRRLKREKRKNGMENENNKENLIENLPDESIYHYRLHSVLVHYGYAGGVCNYYSFIIFSCRDIIMLI